VSVNGPRPQAPGGDLGAIDTSTRASAGAALPTGVCRFCACQEHSPCEGGCAWTDASQTLCTACLGAVAILIELVKELGVTAAKPRHGIHVARADWEKLALEQQRILVGVCRRWLDGVERMIAADFSARAIENGEDLDGLAAFLLERCPDELRGDESPVAVVIRLLEPHLGGRIVMP
jgi:hypothetical protein